MDYHNSFEMRMLRYSNYSNKHNKRHLQHKHLYHPMRRCTLGRRDD